MPLLERRPLTPRSDLLGASLVRGSARVGLDDTANAVTTTTTTSNKGEILSYLFAGAVGFALGQVLRIT